MRACSPALSSLASLLTIIAFLVLGSEIHAQSTATIEGLIVDRSGAVISGVEIRAVASAAGNERLAITDSSGRYQIGALSVSRPPKRILVLYWYDKDFPANSRFDQSFQAALQSTPAGTVEYYSEYLESNRFPGENQSQLLHDYLRQKYADLTIDVVVATADPPLDFLLKYRDDLFPNAPIVFSAVNRPTTEELAAGRGLTGIIKVNTHKQTLDLALRLHPGTEQVFVISGTIQRDKEFEILARQELQGYERRVQITYLTDLGLNELIVKMRGLPERSIVLYVWQQSRDEHGKLFEAATLLTLIAQSSHVPIYAMSGSFVGDGIIGGYVSTAETSAARLAEVALQIANGARAQDIPVEGAPTIPMFDWRELRRWGISEAELPPGSIVRFKEVTFWELYKWRVIGVLALCAIEALLIVALLLQRTRSRRAEESRRLSEEKFSKAFRSSPDAFLLTRQSDGAILEVNDRLEAILGYSRIEAVGRTPVDLDLYVKPEDRMELNRISECGTVQDFEMNIRTKAGDIRDAVLSAESITINNEPCFLVIIRDITKQKQSEGALRNLTGQLIHLQDEERRRIAAELHDGLGQSLVIINNRAMICMRDPADLDRVTEQLEEISATATSAIDEVHEIAHNLRPYELDRLGLVQSVKSMIGKVSDFSLTRVSTDLDLIDGLLSPAAETSVYRIVQEGLNNVVKHAGATEARVSIKQIDGQLVISVGDNGKGIRAHDGEVGNGRGFGLAGIAERARMLGGSSAVESQPEIGTTLTVTIGLSEVANGRQI